MGLDQIRRGNARAENPASPDRLPLDAVRYNWTMVKFQSGLVVTV